MIRQYLCWKKKSICVTNVNFWVNAMISDNITIYLSFLNLLKCSTFLIWLSIIVWCTYKMVKLVRGTMNIEQDLNGLNGFCHWSITIISASGSNLALQWKNQDIQVYTCSFMVEKFSFTNFGDPWRKICHIISIFNVEQLYRKHQP